VLFYLAVYYLMNLGAFCVVMLVANATGARTSTATAVSRGAAARSRRSRSRSSSSRSPAAAARRLRRQVLRLRRGVEGALYALVVLGLLNSVVSLYYYARVVKVMFLDRPEPTDPPCTSAWWATSASSAVLAAANVVLILRFDWLLALVQSAGRVFTG
jgi:NADH-quinone oxidoreductase subunit N